MMRGGVTFDALGQPFELRFTTNAICRVEERSGKSLESLLADTSSDGKRTLAFRTLLWAGIGGITLETAGEIMDEIGFAEVDRILAESLRLAFPPKEPSVEGNEQATA